MAEPLPPDAENLGLPEESDAPDESQAGGKGRTLIVLAAVLLATALGAGVAYSQFGVIDRTAQGLLGGAPETEDDAPIEYGEFMQIDGLVVNPAGTGGSRYLMVSIGFESPDPAVLEEVTAKDVVVRDAIIGLLSAKNVEALADIGNRDGIKEEIRLLVNEILSEGEIERLYFTQFMLQ